MYPNLSNNVPETEYLLESVKFYGIRGSFPIVLLSLLYSTFCPPIGAVKYASKATADSERSLIPVSNLCPRYRAMPFYLS